MRSLLIATVVVAIAAGVYVLWPGDSAPGPDALAQPTPALATPARRSLAQQLDDAFLEAEGADAGRGAVLGLVVNEEGQSVPGARVTAVRAGGAALTEASCPVCSQPILDCTDLHTAQEVVEVARSGKGQPRLLGSTTTDAEGKFRFDDLPQEELVLAARKGELAARAHHEPGDEAVLALSASSSVTLKTERLEGEEEKPVAGARVTAVSLDSFRVIDASTDGDGLLRLEGLDEGAGIWVLVEAPGLLPRVVTVYSEEEQTQVLLEPARALVVRTAVGGKQIEATVTVVGAAQHPTTQTTQGGHARFDALGTDSYDVSATTGSMVAQAQSVTLEQDVTTLELELRAAAKLLVTVIDEAGDPVEDAEVSASGRDGAYHLGTSTGGALVVLGPMAEGEVTLEVTSGEFRPWRRDLDLRPGETPLEVVLKKGVKVTGTVVDSDGKPVAQAEVSYRPPAGAPSVGSSDAEGAFELVFDEPGPRELTASLDTVGRTTLTVSAPARGVMVRLEPRARLKVYVHDGPLAVAGAAVTLALGDGELSAAVLVTGEDGVAIVSGLEAGSYQVGVQSAEFRQPAATKVELTEGRTAALDIPLDRGLTVSGIVVDSRGAPVPGAEVRTQPWSGAATTDEEGRFALATLDPTETYQLAASTDLLHSAPLSIKGPQPALRLVVAPRPLVTGRVVDSVTGAPVTQFDVDSRSIEAPDGRFSVPVSSGTDESVTVTIGAAGFESLTWEGTLETARDLGTVRLRKAKRIEGVVVDARGGPVSGAAVTCGFSPDEVISAADGSFRLELSVPEPDAIIVAVRGQQKGTAAVEVGRMIRVVLVPPTQVVGQVLDANGRGVQGAVKINDGAGSDEVEVEAGPDGAFTVELARGRWAFSTRLSPVAQSFPVAGRTMRVVLGEPPGSCALTVQSALPPDELLLLPGDAAPAAVAPFEELASIEGAVVFETFTRARLAQARGFRCGSYTLVGRWLNLQRLQRVEVRAGKSEVELQLVAPPELQAAPPVGSGH